MSRPDLVPGNTRLRARGTALLGPARVAHLSGLDLAAVTTELRRTAYGRGLDPAAADLRAALLDAVTVVRRDLLRAVRTAHRGQADEVVGPLLAVYDVADVLTLLRGAAHDLPDEEVLQAVDGVGALDPATARHVVADDPDVVVPRLVAAKLPDPQTAAVLRGAWERFLRHGDLAELELTIASSAVRSQEERLAAAGAAGRPVAAWLAARRDVANVLTAVRLAAAETEDPHGALLPPGRIPVRDVLAVATGAPPGPAVPPVWRPALSRYAATRDAAALAEDLEELHTAEAVRRYRTGDPLGADVPVGFVASVEAETRALRRVIATAPAQGQRSAA